jgi:hypothetical protein
VQLTFSRAAPAQLAALEDAGGHEVWRTADEESG